MTAREHESFSFEDIAEALADIRQQHLTGKYPLQWNGPDRLHHAVAATSPEPSWQFSPEGLANHRDQGRGFWEVYTLVAFQLGFHNGTVREEKNTQTYIRLLDLAMVEGS